MMTMLIREKRRIQNFINTHIVITFVLKIYVHRYKRPENTTPIS